MKPVPIVWTAGQSISQPVNLGGLAPTQLRLPAEFAGETVRFIGYLSTPLAEGMAPDPATASEIWVWDPDTAARAALSLAVNIGRTTLFRNTLAGCTWLALQSYTGASPQVQTPLVGQTQVIGHLLLVDR